MVTRQLLATDPQQDAGGVEDGWRTIDLPGRGTTYAYDRPHPSSGAPTVLLLHGWTATGSLNWSATMLRLAERYRVVGLTTAARDKSRWTTPSPSRTAPTMRSPSWTYSVCAERSSSVTRWAARSLSWSGVCKRVERVNSRAARRRPTSRQHVWSSNRSWARSISYSKPSGGWRPLGFAGTSARPLVTGLVSDPVKAGRTARRRERLHATNPRSTRPDRHSPARSARRIGSARSTYR